VRSKPIFREAYRKRRCTVPVDGFCEWQATKDSKQPYAIGMKGVPVGLAGLGKLSTVSVSWTLPPSVTPEAPEVRCKVGWVTAPRTSTSLEFDDQ
jgi:putative SOS response-associated peptidase YedK